MTLEDKVHAFRLRLFRRAHELKSVSGACREVGVSRSFYYQLKQRYERYGSARYRSGGAPRGEQPSDTGSFAAALVPR